MTEKEIFPVLELSSEKYKFLRTYYLNQLVETGSVLVRGFNEEPFRLRSGGESHIYVDHSIVATYRLPFISLVALIHQLVNKQFKSAYRVVNIDSKVSAQLCGAYTALFGEQMVLKGDQLVRAEKGPGRQLTGEAQNIAILDDVGTSGKTIIESPLLKHLSPTEFNIQAFVGLVREPEIFKKNLAESGITAHWTVTLDEVLKFNLDRFDPRQRESIVEERGIH